MLTLRDLGARKVFSANHDAVRSSTIARPAAPPPLIPRAAPALMAPNAPQPLAPSNIFAVSAVKPLLIPNAPSDLTAKLPPVFRSNLAQATRQPRNPVDFSVSSDSAAPIRFSVNVSAASKCGFKAPISTSRPSLCSCPLTCTSNNDSAKYTGAAYPFASRCDSRAFCRFC